MDGGKGEVVGKEVEEETGRGEGGEGDAGKSLKGLRGGGRGGGNEYI